MAVTKLIQMSLETSNSPKSGQLNRRPAERCVGKPINGDWRSSSSSSGSNPQPASKSAELDGQARLHKATTSNRSFLSALIWMTILLGQSSAANSVFLESCSSNNINQVFCHRDQLYVIQDNTLYYGNSCGQMMTNETIRVTKKFKTAVSMRTAFIDDKNSILLFSVSNTYQV